MKIGIVGAGMLGASLARRLSETGHKVKLANSRGPETLSELATGMGADAVKASEAVANVDLVVLSIPQGSVAKLPTDFFAKVPMTVPIVDTGNYYPGLRDDPIAEIEDGMPESVWVSGEIGRPVVKAFNSISFTSLAGAGRPAGDPDRIALPVAGEDEEAKATVIALMDDIGFDGLDAGSLEESWRQQPGTPCYCTDLSREKLERALAMAERDRSPERRDAFIGEMREAFRKGGEVDLIGIGRSIYGAPE